VLHPAYTWKWLRLKWKNRQDWITILEAAVRNFWLSSYANLTVKPLLTAELIAWMDAALLSDEDGDISAPKIDEYSR
jgi:hypothetical protein